MHVRLVEQLFKQSWKIYFLLVPTVTASIKPCSNFEFPAIESNGSALTISENESFTLRFSVNPYESDCPYKGSFILYVAKTGSHTKTECALFHQNLTCQDPVGENKCTCPSVTDPFYHLNYTPTRDDNSAVFVWSTDSGIIQKRNITFNVLYPPVVTAVEISSVDPVAQGSEVTVNCSYDEGNPPVTARLLDRRGVEMEGSIYSSGQIRYRFPAVDCQDAGLIHCEAPGASHNKSATLRVKCSPEVRLIEILQHTRTERYLVLEARAHTTKVHECRLNKSVTEIGCSIANVTGTPPDLVLTVRLDNVTKQDEGRWTLTLNNDVGQGHLNFSLNLTEGEATEDQSTIGFSTVLNNGAIKNVQTFPTPGDDPSFEFVTSVVTATAAAVVAVVIVVVAVCWGFRRRNDSKNRIQLDLSDAERLHSIFSSQPALSARLARSEECVMLPNFLYDCSRSLPDMCEGPYAEVHDHTGPKRIDINNRPPAPLPPDARDEEADKVSSEYAVVDGDAEGTDEQEAVVSTSDYVPIRDILERKRETQFEDASDVSEEGDDEKNVPSADGSTMSLDLKLFKF